MSTSELIAWSVVVFGLLPLAGTAVALITKPFRRKSH